MARSLTLAAVAKRYGSTEALRGVDLEVAEGQLVVVLGPSGCGKSTLLRVVAGLEEADAGTVRIGDRDVTRLPAGRRNVSMVFQSYALFPHLTVRENIGFGLAVRGMPKAEAASRVDWAAGLVGCTPFLDRRPAQLSGGERQRVALARALVREPDAWLLDEPLSNLDAELRAQMRAELKALHARLPTTTLYVTHDQTEALTLGDRIAVMRAGRLEQVGTPDEIWSAPASVFVARFVGSPAMNLVPAGALPVDARGAAQVGIRPEHVALDGAGLPAAVTLVEPVGSEALVHLDAGGVALVARVDAAARPAVGDRVGVVLDAARLHRFDEAGRRVAP